MKLDTSNELHLHKYMNGIKLLKPCHKNQRCNQSSYLGHSVADLWKLPFPVGFLNANCLIENVNEISAQSLGFESTKRIISKTIFDMASLKTAKVVNNNNRITLKNRRMNMFDEVVFLNNGDEYLRLNIQLPWYGEVNNLVGLFGFTITAGKQSLSESILLISKLGLLDLPQNSRGNDLEIFPGIHIDGVYLSKREAECLRYVVFGKSARETALSLGLSKRTVESYVNNIKNKLNLYTKSELVEKAIPYFMPN